MYGRNIVVIPRYTYFSLFMEPDHSRSKNETCRITQSRKPKVEHDHQRCMLNEHCVDDECPYCLSQFLNFVRKGHVLFASYILLLIHRKRPFCNSRGCKVLISTSSFPENHLRPGSLTGWRKLIKRFQQLYITNMNTANVAVASIWWGALSENFFATPGKFPRKNTA